MRQGKKVVMGLSWVCHGLEARNRLRIDNYDELLSAMHRLFAQIVLDASNEPPDDTSAVEQRQGQRRWSRCRQGVPGT